MERPVFNFTEPKKKRGAFDFETGPFPVPIETLTGVPNGGRQWSYYRGRLEGNSVLVDSSQEMEALYQMVIINGLVIWGALLPHSGCFMRWLPPPRFDMGLGHFSLGHFILGHLPWTFLPKLMNGRCLNRSWTDERIVIK